MLDTNTGYTCDACGYSLYRQGIHSTPPAGWALFRKYTDIVGINFVDVHTCPTCTSAVEELIKETGIV